jgi:hypothetical protein
MPTVGLKSKFTSPLNVANGNELPPETVMAKSW